MKAGAFTPAIRAGGVSMTDTPSPLNEGGGFHPRDPALLDQHRLALVDRSMKAGAFTPAIPSWVRGGGWLWMSWLPLNEGGGFHPRNPTSPRRRHAVIQHGPLNEGGGFHPRDPTVEVWARVRHQRSMKAGAFTPAILAGHHAVGEAADRSMKAGAFTPAIRRGYGPSAGASNAAQ